MDWQDIKWFHEVVVHGSFSAAARAAGTTQATISRRIRALEEQLGVDLFDRSHHGSALTESGRRLAEAAAAMSDACEQFVRQHAALKAERQTIVVTCGALIGLYLSKHLDALGAGVDRVNIEIKTTSAFLDLDKGEADIALRNRRPTKGQLKAKRIDAPGYGAWGVFGSDTHFAAGEAAGLDALAGYPWVSYAKDASNVPSARWVSTHIGDEHVHLRVTNSTMLLEVVGQNRAVAALPRFLGRQTPGLVEVFGPLDEIDFDLWIVRRESSDRDAGIVALARNIERVFTEIPP